jgi:Domain of unknown function (DUF4412)
MKTFVHIAMFILVASAFTASAFEGRISVTSTRGGAAQTFLYTAGTNQLRIERAETDRPYAKNILNLDTGDLTLLFPHNRSFMRLKSSAQNTSTTPSGSPAMPGVGPQTPDPPPQSIGPTNLPGAPVPPPMPATPQMQGAAGGMPAMPMMPPPMMEKIELKATGDKTNLLGYACEKFEIKQRGEVMEIWATYKLLPFQPYQQNQPPRFGPRMIEEQWGELLKAKKLFPLLVVLRFDLPAVPDHGPPPAGPERFRFEVKAIAPEKIKDQTLFQPPPDYHEIQPLPF